MPNFPTAKKKISRNNPPTGPGSVSNAPKKPDFALRSPVGSFLFASKILDTFLRALVFSIRNAGEGASEALLFVSPALVLQSDISRARV